MAVLLRQKRSDIVIDRTVTGDILIKQDIDRVAIEKSKVKILIRYLEKYFLNKPKKQK